MDTDITQHALRWPWSYSEALDAWIDAWRGSGNLLAFLEWTKDVIPYTEKRGTKDLYEILFLSFASKYLDQPWLNRQNISTIFSQKH